MKHYKIAVQNAEITFENVPSAFVRDWLLHHARRRDDEAERHGSEFSREHAAALTRAAMIVQKNWGLSPQEETP